MDKEKKELRTAVDIQMRAFVAINDTLNNLATTESHSFPDYPLMLPTLYLAAMCQFINSYISTFPENMKSKMLSMAYDTIGFIPEDLNSLASMKVAGNA